MEQKNKIWSMRVTTKSNECAILFDLDGTLIDSTEAILESFAEAFRYFSEPVPEDEKIKKLIGLPLEDMFSKLGVEERMIDAHVEIYKAHYRSVHLEKTVLIPYAKEAVVLASQYAKLGIVTTKTSKYSRELMEHFGLMEYFEVLIGRQEVVHPKPDPEPALKALSTLGFSPTPKHWMIGDTCIDMEASRTAGISGIAVSSGYGDIDSLLKCSRVVKENVYEAVQYLTQI